MNLNGIADTYAGVLALVGLGLTILFGALAVYFYFNPRRPTYRVVYKVFSRNLINAIARDGSLMARNFRMGTPEYAIDIWNAGRESITPDVIRKNIKVALQAEDVNQGVKITSFRIDAESHPGSSGFDLEQAEERLSLRWRHFDPGMCVRIRVGLNKSINETRIAVFGEGLRLELRKARIVSEMKGLPRWIVHCFVFGIPAALLVFVSGVALLWLTRLELNESTALLAGVPALIGAVVVLLVAVALGAAVNGFIEWLMNVKSPLEKTQGAPFERRYARIDGGVAARNMIVDGEPAK